MEKDKITLNLNVELSSETIEKVVNYLPQCLEVLKTLLNQTETAQISNEIPREVQSDMEHTKEPKNAKKRKSVKIAPTEEQPTEEQPAEEQPAEEQPAEEQPAEEQPTEEQRVPSDYKALLRQLVSAKNDKSTTGNNFKAIKAYYSNLGVKGTNDVTEDKYFEVYNFLNTLPDA